MYNSLNLSRLPGENGFPYKMIWIPRVPSKITAFLWMVMHKKILTHDNLQK
ncbi:unnamed protein product [Linum tenue]|uniref:Reverse transcriptase zinc-binding domain-containing protein n=1 Tax=Linum tenue TaxID=586396 RepID=A0AAV0RX67_9ROSI|nr:unnamed protein product [Linum tenue]